MIVDESGSAAVAAALPLIAEAAQAGLAKVAADWELWPPTVKVAAPAPGWSALYVRDRPRADEQGVEGYHDRNESGEPVGYVFASLVPGGELLRDPGGRAASLAGLISHELIEMVGDRSANCYRRLDFHDPFTDTQYAWVAEEWCDPVQESALGISIASGHIVDFSNYVRPNWFRPDATENFDALGLLHKPLTIAAGGYVIAGDGKDDTSIFGELAVVHHACRQAPWREAMKAGGHSRTSRRRRAG